MKKAVLGFCLLIFGGTVYASVGVVVAVASGLFAILGLIGLLAVGASNANFGGHYELGEAGNYKYEMACSSSDKSIAFIYLRDQNDPARAIRYIISDTMVKGPLKVRLSTKYDPEASSASVTTTYQAVDSDAYLQTVHEPMQNSGHASLATLNNKKTHTQMSMDCTYDPIKLLPSESNEEQYLITSEEIADGPRNDSAETQTNRQETASPQVQISAR